MTTTQDRTDYIVVSKDFLGWKKGDIMCAIHHTGYSPGCMACRSLPAIEKGAKVEW